MATREIVSNINPDRIRWCCEELKLSLDVLSNEIKVPQKKLATGKLTFRQLEKMGKYFGYGVLFFLESEPPNKETVHSVAFRTLTNQKIACDRKLNKLIKRIENHRDFYLGLLEDLGESSILAMPELSGTIAKKAKTARQWLGLGRVDTYQFSDYRKAVENTGILIFQSMGYQGAWRVKHDDLVGFSMVHDQAPVIFVKKTSPERQVFTLFHELGHLLLHQSSCMDDVDNLQNDYYAKQEKEANQFAGLCLLPDDLMKQKFPQISVTPEEYASTFKTFSSQLGLSVEVIVVRLLQMEKITQSDYQRYKKSSMLEQQNAQHPTTTKQAKRKYRHREPRYIFGDRYVGVMLDAWHGKHITLNKASDYLDRLKIQDIYKLDQSYVRV